MKRKFTIEDFLFIAAAAIPVLSIARAFYEKWARKSRQS